MMREAVSLMGGYGITEDCPGFLGNKWMDAQLEATYEGPEAVQRRQLSVTMTNPVFLAQFRSWIREMREIASEHPGTGACALATAMTAVAVDARSSATYEGRRWRKAVSECASRCHVPAGRCAVLADGGALPDSRRAAIAAARRRKMPRLAEGLPGLSTS